MVTKKRWVAGIGLMLAAWMVLAELRAPNAAESESSPRAVDFARDVYPIFQRSCIECHGPQKQEGDLRLDRRQDALEFGVIDPGAPEDSELVRRIQLTRGHDEVMPAIGDPLSKRQVEVVRRWIQQGAVWPEDFEPAGHWAYAAPTRPALPEVANPAWARSPLDYFVLKRLEEEGLEPSPRAAPETLVRRVFLDLIGLPPTPEEVDAFLADPSDARFEQLVDELLKRPQFGERWARPWLDLARYADSHGFQRDNLRDIWAYRDWVIQAMNEDLPFDRFTIEQIAGDLLPNATEAQKIATGFHRCTPTNVEAGSLPEETRIEQVIDRVNTTGAVWLGTTLECCQCHDHKYDPFQMEEYYRLLAFYNSTQLEADRTDPKKPSSIQFKGPSMPLSDAEQDERRSELNRQLSEVQEERKERRQQLAGRLDDWASEFRSSLADVPQAHPLDVVHFESQGTTDSFEKLEDGSLLLVGGDPPDKDEYTVRVQTQLTGIRGFRLEALQHDSLPGKGPGRGDPQRRNFVLNEFSVELRAVPERVMEAERPVPRRLKFSGATADFSQKGWDVAGAVDGDPKTGWAIAPQFDRGHEATFVLTEPLDVPADHELVFTLVQQWGQARTIGCFRLSAITGNLDLEAIPGKVVTAVKKQPDQWSPVERKTLLDYLEQQDAEIDELAKRIARIEQQIKKLTPDTTLVMIELEEPRPSMVFQRGDYRQPGEPVEPGTPAALHPMPEGPPNRLTLARWLVSPDNPLVARVTVNRWWGEMFGQGLVTTPEDFGIKGELPSHPELLDWLAVELMENGWSRKQLLKTIVLSATYQQSSHATPRLLELDDTNRLLARGPRFRMDAEMIRDNALAISGLLDLKQFGPPIRPYQPDGIWRKVGGTAYKYEVSDGSEQHRRGIYVVLKRGAPYPSFINFDATARLACTVQRSRTNTPLQALTLLNDPVYVEAARALAARVRSEKPSEPLEAQLRHAFRLCTARKPDASELAALRDLYQGQFEASKARSPQPSSADLESAAWYSVATVLLNLHETIVKN